MENLSLLTVITFPLEDHFKEITTQALPHNTQLSDQQINLFYLQQLL
jgi:hypothetical protein